MYYFVLLKCCQNFKKMSRIVCMFFGILLYAFFGILLYAFFGILLNAYFGILLNAFLTSSVIVIDLEEFFTKSTFPPEMKYGENKKEFCDSFPDSK